MDVTEFEERIRDFTKAVPGQFPRPWMTKMQNPLEAEVFVVGHNQRNGYSEDRLSHDRHVNALFNRNGETCRGVYDEVTGGCLSPTRHNTDDFVNMLRKEGICAVLETNVVCYSSPMSADLRDAAHAGGAIHGTEIFRFLLDSILPRCIVVHGAGAGKKLSRMLGYEIAPMPDSAEDVRWVDLDGQRVFTIPSLAPPAFNKWSGWAKQHLRLVARAVAAHVLHKGKAR